MPPATVSRKLIEKWAKLGRYKTQVISGMAVSVIYEPIPWVELDAYANRNRVGDWELKYIYAMSKMFCDSYNHHKNKRLPAPYIKDGWDMDSLMIKAAYQKAMQLKKAKASK